MATQHKQVQIIPYLLQISPCLGCGLHVTWFLGWRARARVQQRNDLRLLTTRRSNQSARLTSCVGSFAEVARGGFLFAWWAQQISTHRANTTRKNNQIQIQPCLGYRQPLPLAMYNTTLLALRPHKKKQASPNHSNLLQISPCLDPPLRDLALGLGESKGLGATMQ